MIKLEQLFQPTQINARIAIKSIFHTALNSLNACCLTFASQPSFDKPFLGVSEGERFHLLRGGGQCCMQVQSITDIVMFNAKISILSLD